MKLIKNSDYRLKATSSIFAAIILVVSMSIGNIGVSGQTESPTPTSVSNPTSTSFPEAKNENYRIGPGDIIDVVVSKQPVLSRNNIRVSNEGMIQLPMLDEDIPAICMTEKELSVLIAEKYKKYLVSPNVIVSVSQFNSTPVALIGSVFSPTRFQLQRPMRLMEVLLLGNGPNNQAGPVVQIIRLNSNNCYQNVTATDSPKEELLTLNWKETLEGKDEANPYIQPGDVVRVIEAEIVKTGQAYIIGNINNAKTIDLKEPVTLTQAIAMAGGTTSGAQLDKVKISRQIVGSLSKNEIIVNLKEVKKKNEGDVLLQANDIIEVPGPTGTKKFFQDILKTIVPNLTRLPVRALPVP